MTEESLKYAIYNLKKQSKRITEIAKLLNIGESTARRLWDAFVKERIKR